MPSDPLWLPVEAAMEINRTSVAVPENGYELAIEDSMPWADEVIRLVEHRST